MTSISSVERLFVRFPSLPAAIFGGLLVGMVLIVALSVANIIEQYGSYGESLERVARLPERPHSMGANGSAAPPGSPFLEGQTATVASAMLMQRVTGSISAASGTVVSSETEQGGAQSKDGYLRVVATFEIPHEALQRVLHDLEAGMPFLFVEQMIVQTPINPAESGRLRVRLGVSGLWPGGRS